MIKTCQNGHQFEKSSSCPVCPICSEKEMSEKYGEEFPKIGAPALRALDNAGITHLSDLTEYSEEALLALHGMGPKAIELLRNALKEKGMTFK